VGLKLVALDIYGGCLYRGSLKSSVAPQGNNVGAFAIKPCIGNTSGTVIRWRRRKKLELAQDVERSGIPKFHKNRYEILIIDAQLQQVTKWLLSA
jgi:hypothetical protein